MQLNEAQRQRLKSKDNIFESEAFSNLDGIEALTVLHGSSKLKVLKLNYCTIHSSAVQQLVRLVQSIPMLEVLIITNCNLDDYAAKCLADALIHNKTLKTLNLYSNNIKSCGAAYLADAIKNNIILQELILYMNSLDSPSDSEFQRLDRYIKRNKILSAGMLQLFNYRDRGELNSQSILNSLEPITSAYAWLLSSNEGINDLHALGQNVALLRYLNYFFVPGIRTIAEIRHGLDHEEGIMINEIYRLLLILYDLSTGEIDNAAFALRVPFTHEHLIPIANQALSQTLCPIESASFVLGT